MTPDPWIGSVRPSNPSSWNRYAYGISDPVNQVDRTGRVSCDDWDPDTGGCDDSGSSGGSIGATGGCVDDDHTVCVDGGGVDPVAYCMVNPNSTLCSSYTEQGTTGTQSGGGSPSKAMSTAVSALDSVPNAGFSNDLCQKDLTALGLTPAQMINVSNTVGPVDGTQSNAPVAAVSGQTPDFPGETVRQFFAQHPDATTLAGTLNNVIYINPADWAAKSSAAALGTMLHEIVHFLGLNDQVA